MLRYSETEKTVAGWWDRPSKSFQGIALESAIAENPDLITVEVNCDVLQQFWLIDLPSLDETAKDRAALFALAQLADVMIWCADGCEFGGQDDRVIAGKLPAHLRRNAMLALTHTDLMNDQQDEAARAKLRSGHSIPFRSCSPIALPLAWNAFNGGSDIRPSIWSDSGAEDLVFAVHELAQNFRSNASQKPERIKQQYAATRATSLPVLDTSDARDLSRSQMLPDHLSTLRGIWREKVLGLLALLENAGVADSTEFLELVRECLVNFLATLTQHQTEEFTYTRVVEEFENASNLLVLLKFEPTDRADVDAARVLLQLADCFANAWPLQPDEAIS